MIKSLLTTAYAIMRRFRTLASMFTDNSSINATADPQQHIGALLGLTRIDESGAYHSPQVCRIEGDPPPGPSSMSVNTFCIRNEISRSGFYKAVAEGWGPRLMRTGTRPHVSFEAEKDWKLEREREAAERGALSPKGGARKRKIKPEPTEAASAE
jgi:hypothetical protein